MLRCRPLLFRSCSGEIFEWSTYPHPFWLQKVLSILLTPDTLTTRTSSSDLRIIPDITRSAEDSLLIMVAWLTISSAQLCTDALDRRLLVPTCITIALGFLRKTGLIWSLMSIIVQPGNEETLTFADLEIFRSWRFFKIESPAINTSFLFADLFVGSFLALSGVRVALSVRLLEF